MSSSSGGLDGLGCNDDAVELLMTIHGHVVPGAPARDIAAPLHAPGTGGGGSGVPPSRSAPSVDADPFPLNLGTKE